MRARENLYPFSFPVIQRGENNYLKRGYNVVANSRNISKANPFPASPNLALVDGDIGDPKTAVKIVDTAISRFGRVDALINNAGIFIPKPFTEYTTEDLNALVSTTPGGFLYVSQLAVKHMLKQKTGSIINVSTALVDQPIAWRTGDRSSYGQGQFECSQVGTRD